MYFRHRKHGAYGIKNNPCLSLSSVPKRNIIPNTHLSHVPTVPYPNADR